MAIFDFITTGWGSLKPGIERAIEQRIRLFEKNHWMYRLVTTELDLNLHEHTKLSNIPNTEVVNLYDYFAGDLETKTRKFNLETLKKKIGSNLKLTDEGNGNATISNDIRIIKRVYYDLNTKRIITIDTYDDQGHKVCTEYFDSRGFRAIEDLFDENNQLISQSLYNSKGERYFQKLFRHNQHTHRDEATLYLLFWKNNKFSFSGETELIRFFFDVLAFYDVEQHIMIIDRTNELGEAALTMKYRLPRYMYLHSDHINSHEVNDKKDYVVTGSVNPNYEYALNHLQEWDGILMSTDWQEKVFKKRYGNLIPTYPIPVGFIPNKPHKVKWENRTPYKIICVARLSPEKQQEHLIRAFESVISLHPEARLEFWGYDNGEKKRLLKIVKECDLDNVVKFCGYDENVDHIYNSAQLSVLPSNNEGFALALLESIAHGVPTLAYDAPYGARSIITDGEDGYVVPLDNINELANKINEAFLSQKGLHQMSENAYRNSLRFSEAKITEKWQHFVKDATKNANKIETQFEEVEHFLIDIEQENNEADPDRKKIDIYLEKVNDQLSKLKKSINNGERNHQYVSQENLG